MYTRRKSSFIYYEIRSRQIPSFHSFFFLYFLFFASFRHIANNNSFAQQKYRLLEPHTVAPNFVSLLRFFFLFYFLFRDYYRLSGRVMWISHVVTPQGASKQRYHIAPFLALLYTVCMYKSDAKILMVVIKLSVSNINTVALISFVLYLLVSLESNFNQKYNRSYVCRNRSPRKIITLAVDFHSI